MRPPVFGRITSFFLAQVLALSFGAAACARRPPAPGSSPRADGVAPATPASHISRPGGGGIPGVSPPASLGQIGSIDLPEGANLAGEQPLSPNGQWVVVRTYRPGRGDGLVAYPATGGPGRTVAMAPADLVDKGGLFLYPTGWAGDERLVFTSQGAQADGQHLGSKGVSVRVVDLAGESDATEVAWIPTAGDEAVQVFQAARQVLVFVGTALWKADLGGPDAQAPLSKIDLPGPEAAFGPLVSPAGTHYVYFDRKTPGSPLRVFDTGIAAARPAGDGAAGAAGLGGAGATGGAESEGAARQLALRSDEMGFRPVWSPDGKRLAFYGVRVVHGTGDKPRYDVIPGEDGPAPVGDFVGIAGLDGTILGRLEVEGSRIADFEWSRDGNSVVFVTVRRETGARPGQSTFEWQSIWAGDASNTWKVCDLPPRQATWIDLSPALLEPAALHFSVEQRESNSLWFVKQGLPPVEIEMPRGGRLWMTSLARSMQDSAVMMIEGEHRQVVVVRGDKIIRTLVDRGRTMTGNVAAGRLVCWIRDAGTGKPRLVVYGPTRE